MVHHHHSPPSSAFSIINNNKRTTNTTTSKERSSCQDHYNDVVNDKHHNDNHNHNDDPTTMMYTLGQHAHHLHLKSEVFHSKRYWYMDFTPLFVRSTVQMQCLSRRQRHDGSSHNCGSDGAGIVKEYCQPFQRIADLQDLMVGLDTSSMRTTTTNDCSPIADDVVIDDDYHDDEDEPLPVRTVLIRLRPDCDHIVVFGALNEAFASLHPNHHVVLRNADNCFLAVGGDGAHPVVLNACLTTSKKVPTLERHVLLRFYHVEQVQMATPQAYQEMLETIGQDELANKRGHMTPLHSQQTPLNNLLGEACAMLQNMFHKPELVRVLKERALEEEQDPRILAARNKKGRRQQQQPQQKMKTSSAEVATTTSDTTDTAANLSLQHANASVLYEIPAPMNSTRESSKFFLEHLKPSPSVLDIQNNNNNNYHHRSTSRHNQHQQHHRLPIFPSLSHKDYDVLQESWPLLDRIWSELEMAKCTYNTLVESQISRFGMRPCQPTLDKDYCIQLFQVSQQRMLQDLKSELEHAESALHETLQDYTELEHQLTNVTMMRKYNIPLTQNDLVHDGANSLHYGNNGGTMGGRGHSFSSTNNPFHPLPTQQQASYHAADNLDIGQSPISLMQRDPAGFPWEFDAITLALQDVTQTITVVCLESQFDPIGHSLAVCERSVDHVFAALERANDTDQQSFLKRRNRQAMVRLTQQQVYLKDLLRKLGRAPVLWPGLPKLQDAVERWQEIAAQATNKDEARPQSNWVQSTMKKHSKGDGSPAYMAATKTVQVPLLEFNTKFGAACITQGTLVLLSEIPFLEGSKAYELNKVDVVAQPKGSMHKIAVLRHGKRLCGFSPTTIDPEAIAKFIRLLKSLQAP